MAYLVDSDGKYLVDSDGAYLYDLNGNSQEMLLTGLKSWWSLDEASGAMRDAHGSNHLTETGGAVASAAGKVGKCRDFSGANYGTIVDNASLSTGDVDFTFACWAKLDIINTVRVIACKGWAASGDNREWVLYHENGSNKFIFAAASPFGTGSINNNASLGTIVINTWYHIVCWHDSVLDQIGICVNGTHVNTGFHNSGLNDGVENFSIGNSPLQNLFFDGKVDEAAFWKRALTADERTALYNGGAGLSYGSISGGAGGVLRGALGGALVGALHTSV